MRRARSDIVRAAKDWLGTPYRHQASMLGAGCDCLGLLRGVWREVVGDEPFALPPYSADWRDQAGTPTLVEAAKAYLVSSPGPVQEGDVILFRLHRSLPPKHCGIVSGPGAFIHAQEQIGVVEAPLSMAWTRRIAGIYQFPQVAQN